MNLQTQSFFSPGWARLLALLTLGAALTACGLDADSTLARGNASFEQHQYRSAMIDALSVLEAEPDLVEARLLLGKSMLQLGDVNEAIRHLEVVRDSGAPLTVYAVELAKAYANSGDGGRSLELLESVPETVRSADHRNFHAAMLVAGGSLDQAEAVLAARESDSLTSSQRAERLSVRASLRFAYGDPLSAEALIGEALQTDPASPDIWSMAGRLAQQAGALQLAEQRLERAVGIFFERSQQVAAATDLLQLVRVQLAQGSVDEAIGSAQRLSEALPDSPVTNIASGMVAMQQREYERAIDSLRRAEAVVGNDPEVRALLGSAHLAAGNLAQAEQHLAASVAVTPHPEAVRLLAETRIRQGRVAAAIQALELVDDEQISRDPRLAAMLGAAHIDNGNPSVAISVLSEALALAPTDPALSLTLARAYLANGRAEEAGRVIGSAAALGSDLEFASKLAIALSQLQAQGPAAALQYTNTLISEDANAGAHVIAALVNSVTAGPAAARESVDQALRLDPDFVPGRLLAAALEIEGGRTTEAQQHFEHVLSIQPGHNGAAVGLTQLLASAGDFEGARAVLRAAVSENPSIESLSAQGELERRLGNADGALEISQEIKDRYPQRSAGHELEGRILAAQQRNEAAWHAYQTAYEIEPRLDTLEAAVAASHQAGNSGWETLLRERLRATPDDLRVRLMFAEGLQSAGRTADALDEYERVIAGDGRNIIALNNAAWLAHEAGAPGALEYAERARSLAPENPAVLDTYGWLLTESGRAREGLAELERAAGMVPRSLEIRYHLAVAQAETGSNDAARRTIEMLLAEAGGTVYEQLARDLLQSL